MALNLAKKILKAHLVEGSIDEPGKEIAIKIDQCLTQDATGTMAYLEFEALGLPRVKAEVVVSYVDHNMLQMDFKNADDHRYLQSTAEKFGAYFSRPGNGICHQVHRERFAIPGKTIIGSDSHTPTSSALGAIAIGAGGLDVAVAMAGQPFNLPMPKIVGVKLTGKLNEWITGKDVIFEVLRILTAKGGTGKIIEYYGPGANGLSMSERFTICNMGAELGATTSVFPSDKNTLAFLKAQRREKDWKELNADGDATYDENIEIDLSTLEPLMAAPHNPDNIVKVRDYAGKKVDQVNIGSCTNSSYEDLMVAGAMLEGKTINPRVSFTVSPGSRQVFQMVTRDGGIYKLITAGARILESGCGPCIGMGSAPPSKGVSVRSFNRNFAGRSGTMDSEVFLASPEVCVACAITGEITDPRDLKIPYPKITVPDKFIVDDSLIIPPLTEAANVEIVRGPNIAPMPEFGPPEKDLAGKVLLKTGDNISTDHIMPAGAEILPLRSNIPKISEYTYVRVDKDFPQRCRDWGGGMIIGGENYGQGSSREHAAIAPKYLGVKAVLVKSIARIHWSNLVNFGILPMVFADPKDYDKFDFADEMVIPDIISQIKKSHIVNVTNKTKGFTIKAYHALSPRQVEMMAVGGLLPWIREQSK